MMFDPLIGANLTGSSSSGDPITTDQEDETFNYLFLLLVLPLVAVPYLAYYYLRRKFTIFESRPVKWSIFIFCLILLGISILFTFSNDVPTNARSAALAVSISTVILIGSMGFCFRCASKTSDDDSTSDSIYIPPGQIRRREAIIRRDRRRNQRIESSDIYSVRDNFRRLSSAAPSYSEVVGTGTVGIHGGTATETAARSRYPAAPRYSDVIGTGIADLGNVATATEAATSPATVAGANSSREADTATTDNADTTDRNDDSLRIYAASTMSADTAARRTEQTNGVILTSETTDETATRHDTETAAHLSPYSSAVDNLSPTQNGLQPRLSLRSDISELPPNYEEASYLE